MLKIVFETFRFRKMNLIVPLVPHLEKGWKTLPPTIPISQISKWLILYIWRRISHNEWIGIKRCVLFCVFPSILLIQRFSTFLTLRNAAKHFLRKDSLFRPNRGLKQTSTSQQNHGLPIQGISVTNPRGRGVLRFKLEKLRKFGLQM